MVSAVVPLVIAYNADDSVTLETEQDGVIISSIGTPDDRVGRLGPGQQSRLPPADAANMDRHGCSTGVHISTHACPPQNPQNPQYPQNPLIGTRIRHA
jgi:hypothetical protein